MDENSSLNSSSFFSNHPLEKDKNNIIHVNETYIYCGVCKLKYNVGEHIPRILVNCGHTYCSNCLKTFLHKKTIRCPFIYCKKIVKQIDNIEQLPLNLDILGQIIEKNQKLQEMIDNNNIESYLGDCLAHLKQRHFYCSFHDVNICRGCIRQYHREKNCCIINLIDIKKIYDAYEEIKEKNYMLVRARNKTNHKARIMEEFSITNN